MERLLFLLAFVAPACFAGYAVDLTEPENLQLADKYAYYEYMSVSSFEDTDGKYSLVGFKRKKDADEYDSIFSVEVSSSKVGEQRLYVILSSTCSNKDESNDSIVVRTNGQNVKYHYFCNGSYYYVTPVSTAGLNFLVGEFKKKNFVTFEFQTITVTFDAAGFSKTWDSHGGDAI